MSLESDAEESAKEELDKRAEEVFNGQEGEEWVTLEDLM